MFDRFTDDAKRAMSHSRQEAMRLGHDYIGVEHILLGMLRAPCDPVRTLVAAIGGDAVLAVGAIEKITVRGNRKDMGQLPFTPRSKKALENAMETAARCGHTWIGVEHMLIGTVRAAEPGVEAALQQAGIRADELLRAFTATSDQPVELGANAAAPAARSPAVIEIETMEARLRTMVDDAVAAQQFATAAIVRDLMYRCRQAAALLHGTT